MFVLSLVITMTAILLTALVESLHMPTFPSLVAICTLMKVNDGQTVRKEQTSSLFHCMRLVMF